MLTLERAAFLPSVAACAGLLATASVCPADDELTTPDVATRLGLPFDQASALFEPKQHSLSEERSGRYWLSSQAKWGFAAESLETEEAKPAGPAGDVSMANAPSSLELTQGYRLYTLQALYRPRHRREDGQTVRVSPYLGLGAGFAKPHSESPVENYRAGDEYTWKGMRGLAGVSVRLTPSVSFYGEYAVDRPTLEWRLNPKSIVDLDSPAERVQIGVSYDF